MEKKCDDYFYQFELNIPKINKFYNIHYLLFTGSPITTSTQRTLYSINLIEYKNDKK